ncbi:hypothetical protein [Microbaculum marinisediminis]|uniref:Uncharacterized protein n=1 Tax=Microbaculum marinisediminis TaxID=2931392 RepID=A0AAW5QXP0_9HYPH|nr:hypothetical protein [Microbaculum sp. A6E488]MCT8971221.1 hypothetical protein [Microbaculum sp. A6E488]
MLSGRGDETGQGLGEIGEDAGVVVPGMALARVIGGAAVNGGTAVGSAPVGCLRHWRVLSVTGDGRGLAPAHSGACLFRLSAGFLRERGRHPAGIASGDYLRHQESKSGCFLLPYVKNKK